MVYKQPKGIALVSVLLILAVMVSLIAFMVESQFLSARQTNTQLVDERGFIENFQAESWAFNVLQKTPKELYEADFLSEEWSNDPLELDSDFPKKALLIDLQGKFNLNNLSGEKQQIWLPVFRNLLKTLELDETIIFSVIDWVDADQSPINANGAEDLDYLLEIIPKRAANQKFSTVEELLLVKGIDNVIYQKLLPHITVIKDDSIKINLNTASLEVIQSILPNGLTSGLADQLVTAREGDPFRSMDELLESNFLTGVGATLNEIIDIKSEYFEIESVVKIGDVEKKFKMGLKREVSNESVTFAVIYRKRVI